jgi:hypothetical protein
MQRPVLVTLSFPVGWVVFFDFLADDDELALRLDEKVVDIEVAPVFVIEHEKNFLIVAVLA